LGAGAGADSAPHKARHPFARLLVAGIVLGLAASVLSTSHFFVFARNGVGAPVVRLCAQLLCAASRFVLASLLLLLSEGKCVSYVMVSADARRIGSLLGPFLASCLFLELWGDYSVARRYTTDYVYTTSFGGALVFVDLILLSRYVLNLRRTHAKECDSSEGTFYRRWGALYGLWFLALPVAALLSLVVLAPYVWWIISLAVNGSMTVAVYTALVIGLWPGNTRSYLKLRAPMLNDEVLGECSFASFPLTSPSKDSEPMHLPSLLESKSRSYRHPKLGISTVG